MEQREESCQLPLFCRCGRPSGQNRHCRACYDRRQHSLRFFGGLREQILERDRFRCSACRTRSRLLVHHRDQHNQPRSLITLCVRCHMRIHRSLALRLWLAGRLLRLWREMHRADPEQLQFVFNDSLQQGSPETKCKKARTFMTMPLFGDLVSSL